MKLSVLSEEKIAKLKVYYKSEMGINATDDDVLEILICEGYKSLEKELLAKMKKENTIKISD